MASTSYAGIILLVFIIILLGIQYSLADVHEGSSLQSEQHALSANRRILTGGRKYLQGIEGKTRSNKPAAEEFEEEADKVANLMRKDYKDVPKGRRKPPIHNDEPRNR